MRFLEEETKPIKAIWWGVDNESGYSVGGRITEIRCVLQHGTASFVPWFDIMEGENVIARINADHVRSVMYE